MIAIGHENMMAVTNKEKVEALVKLYVKIHSLETLSCETKESSFIIMCGSLGLFQHLGNPRCHSDWEA